MEGVPRLGVTGLREGRDGGEGAPRMRMRTDAWHALRRRRAGRWNAAADAAEEAVNQERGSSPPPVRRLACDIRPGAPRSAIGASIASSSSSYTPKYSALTSQDQASWHKVAPKAAVPALSADLHDVSRASMLLARMSPRASMLPSHLSPRARLGPPRPLPRWRAGCGSRLRRFHEPSSLRPGRPPLLRR